MSEQRINGEPVELVTDFGTLRVGDLIWFVGASACDVCGKSKCRSMVLALGRRCLRGVQAVSTTPCTAGVSLVQVCACSTGNVWRVVNPPRSESADTESRPRTLERTR